MITQDEKKGNSIEVNEYEHKITYPLNDDLSKPWAIPIRIKDEDLILSHDYGMITIYRLNKGERKYVVSEHYLNDWSNVYQCIITLNE